LSFFTWTVATGPEIIGQRKQTIRPIAGWKAQNWRRTTPLSDKATLMHRVRLLFRAIFPALLVSAFLFFSGCASHTQAVRPRLKVQIVSQPTGARIEVNGQYVGDAPVSVDIEASTDGRFWRDTIIKAYPKDTGYTQIKAFNGKSRWTISDMVPPKLFFDTRTDPSAGVQSTQ
jgi:PEGA domain